MSVVLAPFVGDGTEEEPFRVEGASAIIDLRADPTQREGRALAAVEDVPAGADLLVDGRLPDAATARLAKPARDRLANALGVNVEDRPFGRMILDLLLSGRTDGSRWKPLRAERDGHLRVYLGGLLAEVAVPAGGASYSDDFNRAALGDDWQGVDGAASIDDNRLALPTTAASSFPSVIRFVPLLDTDDHWTQIQFVDQQATGAHMGAAVRLAAAAKTCYCTRVRSDSSERMIEKAVNGTRTTLNNFGSGGGPPRTTRLEAEGSTLRLYDTDSLVAEPPLVGSLTDTSIPGNRHAGTAGHSSASSQRAWGDNFLTADLAAAITGRFVLSDGLYAPVYLSDGRRGPVYLSTGAQLP